MNSRPAVVEASGVLDRSMMANPAAVSILWSICARALARPS